MLIKDLYIQCFTCLLFKEIFKMHFGLLFVLMVFKLTLRANGKTLNFAGIQWTVKSGYWGPGPNNFDDTNAFVDSKGNLHLRISRKNEKWTTSEIYNNNHFGYGTYKWTILSDLSNLDANVVLGLFTWSDSPKYAHREIDIEFAKWGNPHHPTNAQYVTQPSEFDGHLIRFAQPFTKLKTKHQFIWEPSKVTFNSSISNKKVSGWVYAKPDVPIPGDENVHINAWLFNGTAPLNGKDLEIIIKKFQFKPL